MTLNDATLTTLETFLADLSRQDIRLWLEDDRLRCSGPEALLTNELNAQLKARKDEIITFLQETQTHQNQIDQSQSGQSRSIQSQSGQSQAPALTPVQRPKNIPLSFAQQRLWFLHQMQPETAVYNLPMAIQVDGFLDVAAFTQSLNNIVERHEILRTRFITVDGQPVQKVVESTEIEIEQINLEAQLEVQLEDSQSSSHSIIQQAAQQAVEQAAIQAAQKPFDLSKDQLLRVTLLKLSDTQSVVLFTVHHIIADGWSQEILIQELATFYKATLLGKKATLPDLPVQYADFSIWQRNWLQGETLQQQLDYWQQQLTKNAAEDTFSVLQLPTDYPRARVQTYRGEVEQFSLPKQLSERLKRLAREQSATLFMTLLAALDVLLYRYTGQTDLMVGTPIANRHRAEVEGLIGLFVNTLVMRSQLSPQSSFTALINQVKSTTWAAYDHQDLPFEKLVEYLQPERDLSYSPLFQVKFRLENAPQKTVSLPGLSFQRLPQAVTTAKLDLSVDLYETDDGIVGGFEYNCDLFKPETIQRMVVHFQTLLESIVASPSSPIAELPMLTAEEQQQQLVTWNDTQKSYRQDCCFHYLFEEQAQKYPEAIALLFDSSSRQDLGKVDQLTYTELNHRSNQLAHQLQSLGVGPETVVGICVKRSPNMIIALLAVLKAGGAYLPLDPTYPADRLTYMLTDAQVPVLLTQSDLLSNLNTSKDEESQKTTPQRINLDTDWPHHQPTTNPHSSVTPNNLAYLIYTSGSTGKPKGVLVPHSGLVNLTEDKIRVCNVRPGDCILQFFSFSFDASIPEIIMALGSGSKLLLAPATTLLPGPALSDLIAHHQVTHMTLTPSALTSVPYKDFSHLRMVLVGGEAPALDLIETWSQNRLFINAYGPTETTVNASMVACGNGHSVEPTLLPSTNKQLYILDNNLQLLPVGVVGELHIGGVGIARGYLNRPQLTAERFIPAPFSGRRSEINHESPSEPGSETALETVETLLYKTGDLACYLPDGRIKVLGRIDTQTKIRGFRIELGEVERIIQSHPQVKTALVTVREDTPGDKRLVGYGVPIAGAEKITPTEMRQFVAETLPQYMVPSAFMWLPKFPLTPNGKVDMQALAAPTNVSEKPQVEPRTETEKLLANIFSQVLSAESVGVYDDFFELGGHSLLATQLVAELLNVFAVEITVIDLFEAATVATLAQRIEQKQQLAQMQPVSGGALESDEEREEFAL